ncbi:CHAP domain-containing protein [Falsiroseomonas oryziterrae]|uniref:CHAP domain-containing protein n=1 Tax=Falsiroseomonas oryziterrae TaxID=2911368 RepID=UPI001F265214|nr:CHAP domain-containing protein [Roseomonas sp. NPKOSM-4]
MRARSALVFLSVIFGAATFPVADAAANQRQSQKQARAPQATAQQAAPARATAQRSQSRPVAARSVQPRMAIAPQEQAQAALLTPAVARFAGQPGTPILPVSISSGLSCVPFARMATGMNISGDARQWWHNAAGTYARGQHPERGAILSFPASGGMSRGHVAVVSRVVNARTIEIDHSNWAGPGIRRGTVMRGVRVVDVSDRNDWTAVRVQVGHDSDTFGRTYPTHGFIYNRPVGERTLLVRGPALQEVAMASSPHARLHMIRAAEALAD